PHGPPGREEDRTHPQGGRWRIHGHHSEDARTKHRWARLFTPQHNDKVECYQQIMAEKVLYAQLHHSEDERAAALATWNIHHNHYRPHSAAGGRPRPHACTPVSPTSNYQSVFEKG